MTLRSSRKLRHADEAADDIRMERIDHTATFRVWPLGSGIDASWDRLARETLAAPFTRPGWVRAWGDAFGHTVSVACLERDGRLVAALPVVVDGGTVRTTVDWHVPLTEVVAVDHEAVIALMRGIDASFRRVVLDFVVDGSLTGLVGSVVLEPRPHRHIVRMRSPYVEATGDWDDYLETVSTKKLRELRRRRRRLAEAHGPVTYQVVDGGGEWETALDIGLAIEASGWKGSLGTAVESDPRTAEFYREVCRWAASQKILEIGLLRAGDRVVAFDCAITDTGRTWLLKTGFDHDLGRHAPGQLLRHDAIQAAFARGLESYEFGGESEPWKTEWTSVARPIVMIDAHARGPLGRVTALSSRVARAARVRMRRRPGGSS